MLSPKPVFIKCQDDSEKEFILSKFPAIPGREIVTQYPMTALPKVADYAQNEAIMLKLLAYVGVPNAENPSAPPTMLVTRALVDNHVPDFECLMRLEAAMLEYNVSFFANGRVSTFFDSFEKKAIAWISRMLTASSAPSSGAGSPPSTN